MWAIASRTALLASLLLTGRHVLAQDPCALIGGKRWVAPAEVRACLISFPLNETIKTNILDVTSRMLAIHTSTNYEAGAPPPFAEDVKEDMLASIERIRTQKYSSLFDMHIDLSNTIKRARDGHLAYVNYCFDSLFVTYLPLPLSHVNGTIVITPEAHQVAQAEFADQLGFWEDNLKMPIKNLSGAKVLSIDGADPWTAVDSNANAVGNYQAKATRQSGYFSSYIIASPKWTYRMGDFAAQGLPLKDQVLLSLQLVNSTGITNITVPYRSRFGSASVNFTDSASLWKNNCVAQNTTNGRDFYSQEVASLIEQEQPFIGGSRRFQYPSSPGDWKQPVNELLNDSPLFDIDLPTELSPPTPTLSGDSLFFYMLKDNKTGVMALGSFSGNFSRLQNNTYFGLIGLIEKGATQLVVDVTNNGGGYICVAHLMHRLIAGPSSKSEPQAGLDTQIRAGPLAQTITGNILADPAKIDPGERLFFNPSGWNFANNTAIPGTYNFLNPGIPKVVNGRQDRFSDTIGNECQPFNVDFKAPTKPLFDPKTKVAVITNGRCGSSCALFTIAMNKHYGTPMVVTHGKPGVGQQYAGIVGGQSTDFTRIQSEAKTAKTENHPQFPPDFITNSDQGITWRLGLGISDPTQPEEWQSRPATYNHQHTDFSTINNPLNLWENVAKLVFR